MAEKSNMPYLAIVVLVAVVAVVVLVLNFRPSSEGAVAGEAVRTGGGGVVPRSCITAYTSSPTGAGRSGDELCSLNYRKSCVFQEPWPQKMEDGTISVPALGYPRDCSETLEFASVAVCCSSPK